MLKKLLYCCFHWAIAKNCIKISSIFNVNFQNSNGIYCIVEIQCLNYMLKKIVALAK